MLRDQSPSPEDQHGDARTGRFGVPDDVAAEMDEAFGYGNRPTDDELDQMAADDDERRQRVVEIDAALNCGELVQLRPVTRPMRKIDLAAFAMPSDGNAA